jgi:uncharacterized spore protein YtfJ
MDMQDIEALLKSTLGEIEKLLNAKSVVGEPITVEGTTIIPLLSIGFGIGAGAGSGRSAKDPTCEGGGSGTGGGGGVKPVAVVVIGKDGVRVEPLRHGGPGLMDKVGDVVTRAMEKRQEGPKRA